MLQYIINASAIWLLSLIVFDIFLSRENYHSYNRFYLLMTFILGLVLPLWSWQDTTVQYATTLGAPIAESAAAVKNGITESKAAATIVDMQFILLFIYATGVAVCVVLLLKELLGLINTYKRGDKFKDGVWTVVETGKQHSPYSAFRYVFISSKNDYTPEQLRIILTHEEQHGHLLHFFDLLFMQIVKIVCWFHPLVYMYAERLSIVHEFQADAAVDKAPAAYGQFLIEQSILQSAPSLSHSFNRSPIKKRILMLTYQSSSFSKSKTLIALPLILICILCFTKNAFSDDTRTKEGNKITYKGNVIELNQPAADTVVMINPSTGKEQIRIAILTPRPEKLNGKTIYLDETIRQRGYKTGANSNTTSGYTDKGIKEYLLTNLKDEIKPLKDGNYYLRIDQVIIDEKGRIAYYDYAGISTKSYADPNEVAPLSKDQQDAIAKKISRLIDKAPTHLAATLDGQYVPSIINNSDFFSPFTMKDGKITAL